MNSLFNTILDGLTFKDIAGKRQPRTYAALTGLILLLLIVLASYTTFEHKAIMDEVQGTPVPVVVGPKPTTSPEPTEATATETCPAKSKDWNFLEILPKDNFRRIESGCVYENLGKSVAWALAIRSGHTRAEAAKALGFAEFPMRSLSEVTTLTDTKGPLSLAVSFTPPHPDFAEWRVTTDGQVALAYALRGCFRTYEVVGNQARPWNQDYPVMCVLSEDSSGSQIVFQLDDHTFTSNSTPTRAFVLFGYAGDGKWVWLGTQKEPKVTLEAIPDFSKEAQTASRLHALPVWDAAWLAKTYGLQAKPLPEGWQSQTRETDKQAILAGLNAPLSEAQP